MQPSKKIRQNLEKLIAFRTVTAEKQNHEPAIAWLDEQFTKAGLSTTREHNNGFPALIAATQNHKHPKVLLAAHLDVVPGKDEQFSLSEHDGRYYGRGVYDMKSAIAIYLEIVREFGNNDEYDFGVMITCDEEVGGHSGAKYLIEQGYACDVCILPDALAHWTIDIGSRGIWHHKLYADGTEAHASRPWDGDSALTSLLLGVMEIEQNFANRKDDPATVVVSGLNAGRAVNQIPDVAECSLDIRYTSEEAYNQVKKTLDEICKKHGLRQEVLVCDPAFSVSADDRYITQFADLIEQATGEKPVLRQSLGTSDARFFAPQNIPVIVSSPIGGNAHGANEWVDVAAVNQYYEIVRQFVIKNAKT